MVDYEDLIQKYGIKHFLLDQYSLKKNPPKLLLIVWRYQQIINEFKPDIVHAQMQMGIKIAKLFKLGKLYKLVSSLHCIFEPNTAVMGWAEPNHCD